MNEIEILSQYVKNKKTLKIYSEKILEAKAKTEKMTANYSADVRGGSTDHDVNLIRLIEQKEIYENEYEKVKCFQQAIERAVFGLSNADERNILMLIYLRGYSITKTTQELNISRSQVFRVKSQAIKNLGLCGTIYAI